MRERDEIWDAFDLHFGPIRTDGERMRRNTAVKQLREAGASSDEIAIAYEFCAKRFTVFTEMAVVNHFGRAQHELTKQARDAGARLALVRKMADGE